MTIRKHSVAASDCLAEFRGAGRGHEKGTGIHEKHMDIMRLKGFFERFFFELLRGRPIFVASWHVKPPHRVGHLPTY
jgi:hypothetical protein